MTAYGPYDVAADMPDGKVNPSRLIKEIQASAIVTALEDVQTEGGTDESGVITGGQLTIVFKADLSPGDETLLDGDVTNPAGGLLAAHDNSPGLPYRMTGLLNEDESRINFPATSSKTPIIQPNVIPAGYYFYGTGAFDNVAAGTRGDGAQIAFACVGENNDTQLVGRFMEHVYVLGGYLSAEGPAHDDWVSLLLRAPASAPGDRTGTSDGNANKVATGQGFNVIVPAPLGDGDWQVDGDVFEAGEINQGLCPVPNPNGAGYWNWDPTLAPGATITPVADPLNPDGAFDLFDVALPLARQANRYPILSAGNVTPEAAIKGKKILPHWEWVFTLHREQAGTAKVAIRLDTARLKTT